jgi:hypothetical protein
LVFSGCTVTQTKDFKTVYTPSINEVAIAEVGQNMFSKTYATFADGVVFADKSVNERFEIYSDLAIDKIGEDCVLTANGTDFLKDYGCKGRFTHEFIPEYEQKQFFVLALGVLGNSIFGSYKEQKLKTPLEYEITSKIVELSDGSFKREIIYQGKKANNIKLTFREFVSIYNPNTFQNDFVIRDAFTQTIDYELDEYGKAIIGFMGLRIKVEKATNLEIHYIVLNDFKD